MSKLIPSYIENLAPYIPGRLVEEVEAELGLRDIVKLGSNENPLGPSPKALAAMVTAITRSNRYSDSDSRLFRKSLSEKLGYPLESILAGNGSSEFILMLCHSLLGPGLKAVMSRPSFSLYALNARAAGAEVLEAPLTPDYGHDLAALRRLVDERTRLVFLDNPLNPTGAWLKAEDLLEFHRSLPEETILVMDEAYVDFSRQPKVDWREALISPGRLAVLRTFSKAYGLAGLRVAYALMEPALVEALNRVSQPFNLNNVAQAAAVAVLDDEEYLRKSLQTVWDGLDYFRRELKALGLEPYPTEANYMMVGLGRRSSAEVFQAILRQGVITRSLASMGLPHHLRFCVGLPRENEALVKAFKNVL